MTDTRNFLTHVDPKLAKKAVKGEELINITHTLMLHSEGRILKEMGASSVVRKDFLDRMIMLKGPRPLKHLPKA